MNQAIDMSAVKQAFDELKVHKGYTVSLATCDAAGIPNVAPVGSARLVDDNTVHVLQAFLGRTVKNVRENPKAAFAVSLKPRVRDVLRGRSGNRELLGYRVYCTFDGVDDSRAAIDEEVRHLLKRLPFWLRKPFLAFLTGNLKRVLKFTITEVRPIA
jgi:hypothetical protein